MTRIVLVTARWQEPYDESGAVVRLIAGALSSEAKVDVVSLAPSPAEHAETRTRRDSVFVVHDVAARDGDRAQAGLLRAALANGRSDRLPEVSGPRLAGLYGGQAAGVVELVASLEPDSVVLAGPETWWLPKALGQAGIDPRVVSVPLLGDDPLVDLPQFGPMVASVQSVGVLSQAEHRRVATRLETGPRLLPTPRPEIIELDVAFSVNRPAASQLMVGMSHFGRFVVLLTGFPPGSPGALRSPGHDYVRQALGPFAVAEVALERWTISDGRQSRVVPVGASRPNLWKLLAHGELCLDLRPQGIVGRETLESLLFGTPVVVPEATIAAEHAERSGGGLWYGNYGEMFDAAKAIIDAPSLRDRLSGNARRWAEETHGDQRRFTAQVARLVLG